MDLQGLAVRGAIAEPEWEYRYFSFDAKWAKGERMASMRNGEGDDRFLWVGPGTTHRRVDAPFDRYCASVEEAGRVLARPCRTRGGLCYAGSV